jgi:hypothetical protein
MNLTLPVLLAAAGIMLLVTGILGKLKVKDWFDIGTESSLARGALAILGLGLIGFSYAVYRPEPVADIAEPVVASAADQDQNTNAPSVSDETAPQVTITSPNSNDQVSAATDEGPIHVSVSGEVENAQLSADERIFVFTNSADGSEWSYNEPAKIDSAGTWKTSTLFGTTDEPAKAGAPIYIQAVLATQKAIDNAKKNKKEKMIGELDDIEGAILSKKVVVYVSAQE